MQMTDELAVRLGLVDGRRPADEIFPPQLIPGAGNAPELCQLANEWTPAVHPDRALCELKADGLRHLWLGGYQCTREGVPFSAASHITPALRALEASFGKPMMFDGEYVHDDGLESAIGDFQRGSGTGTLWLFDAVPLDLWRRNAPTAPQLERKEMLLSMGCGIFGPGLGMLKHFSLDIEGTIAKFNELTLLGWEGVVVKNAVASYDRRRSDRWLKLKRQDVARCRILDVGPGEHGLKHLIVSYQGKSQNVGSGFTADQRRMLLAEAERLPGRFALIQHCGTTASGLMRDAVFIKLDESDG